MTDVIPPKAPMATRTLELRAMDDSNSASPVTVELYEPQNKGGTMGYVCYYRILGIGGEKLKRGAGTDAIQALMLTLVRIGADLYASEESKAGRLSLFQDQNLGFPVFFRDIFPAAATDVKELFL